MNGNTLYWFDNKNKLLTKKKEKSSNVRKLINDTMDINNPSYCEKFFDISDLIIYLGQFLSISSVNSLAVLNSSIGDVIRKANNLALYHLRIIIEPTVKLANNEYLDEKGNHFYNKITNSYYVYCENVNNCMRGTIHPFRSPLSYDSTQCITFKDVFPIKAALKKGEVYNAPNVDQPLHQIITNNVMETFHKTFKNNPISNAIKRYISFSNTRVGNCYIEKYNVDDFLSNWKLITTNNVTAKLKTIDDKMWKKVYIRTKLKQHYSVKKKIKVRASCREGAYFIEFWQKNYYLQRFVHCINWTKNVIMGGSVFQAVVQLQPDTIESPQSDLDIFAHNISYKKWLLQLIKFEEKIMKENIKMVKICCNLKVHTYYLVFAGYKQVKVQFIFTCKSATPAQILTSFDISATQIGFNPYKFTLITTQSFLEFMNDGYASIFDLSQKEAIINEVQLSRVIKYVQRGVKSFKIPSNFSSRKFFQQLNNSETKLKKDNMNCNKDILPVQIALNPTEYISSKMYLNAFTNGSCIRSRNHDETHVLKSFLNLLLKQKSY